MDSVQSLRRGRPLHVTIVADNPETLDGLETYLRRAGLTTRGTSEMEKVSEMTPSASSVVVLFPDDFHLEAVMSALATLRSQRPRTLPVLVTNASKRFERLPFRKGAVAPLVVPKPVWGWTILDAIRAGLERDVDEKERSR